MVTGLEEGKTYKFRVRQRCTEAALDSLFQESISRATRIIVPPEVVLYLPQESGPSDPGQLLIAFTTSVRGVNSTDVKVTVDRTRPARGPCGVGPGGRGAVGRSGARALERSVARAVERSGGGAVGQSGPSGRAKVAIAGLFCDALLDTAACASRSRALSGYLNPREARELRVSPSSAASCFVDFTDERGV